MLRRLDTAMSLATPPYRPRLRDLDRGIGRYVRDLQSPAGTRLAKTVTQAGSWVTHVGVMGDAAVISRRRNEAAPAVAAVVSMAGCAGIYTLVKAVLARERPHAGGHLVRVRDSSFPSGHAATAAAAARTLAELHGWPKSPLFACAVCVAASRVYLGVHHPSDAVAGLVVGWTWASLVFALSGHGTHDAQAALPAADGAEAGNESTETGGPGGADPQPPAGQSRVRDQLGARRRARNTGHPVADDDGSPG
ncbi:MAG: phosphatase PAP2 family protein [Acidimicrobiia bacterium]|nr:phosphatase PAP2 family protein [Acidimicrobiia bacterium]